MKTGNVRAQPPWGSSNTNEGSKPHTYSIQVENYSVTSLMRKRLPPGPYSRHMPRALWWSQGGGRFLMSEVPLYTTQDQAESNRKSQSPGSRWDLTPKVAERYQSCSNGSTPRTNFSQGEGHDLPKPSLSESALQSYLKQLIN
jgi:hypothetical protein